MSYIVSLSEVLVEALYLTVDPYMRWAKGDFFPNLFLSTFVTNTSSKHACLIQHPRRCAWIVKVKVMPHKIIFHAARWLYSLRIFIQFEHMSRATECGWLHVVFNECEHMHGLDFRYSGMEEKLLRQNFIEAVLASVATEPVSDNLK